MIMPRLPGALAFALAACAPEAGDAPGSGDAPAVATARDDILGTYVVKYVDGAPPIINIEGHQPMVTIGEDRIHFQSQCIYADWTYERDGEAISTEPYYEPGSGMCARGLAPGETAIQDAFGAADTIRRIRGGLFLEGGGHRLELHRVADEASKANRAVDLAGEWRVAAIDGRALDTGHGVALKADYEQIWWEPDCALQYRDYMIEGSRFDARPVDLSGQAVCDIGFPDELLRVWSAMDAADTIERTSANGVLISGNGRSVTLFSQ